MSLSGFGSRLTDYVKGEILLNHSLIVSYRIVSLFLITSILIVSAGCNLTVHRKDGMGKAMLAPVPASVPEAGEQVGSGDENNLAVAEVQAEPDQPGILVAEDATREQAEEDTGKEEAPPVAVEISASPIQVTASEQDAPVTPIDSEENPAEQVGKAVNVSGRVVEVQGRGPRAVLASLKIPGGAKLSPIPVGVADSGDGGAELPVEAIGAPPEEEFSPAPEPVAGDTEFTSAVNRPESVPVASGLPVQDDKKEEETEKAAESEEKPSGTGEGDSPGDDKEATGEDVAKVRSAIDGKTENPQFPYGIVIVLVVCLGIAIFQNTAGKSI
tara:strand:- start:343 stop:1326 length:984 start_codon:yes stop_codon:yes gene_type:complete